MKTQNLSKTTPRLLCFSFSILFILSFSVHVSAKDYEGTWTANKGKIKLVLAESTFELSDKSQGKMGLTSKGTISVEGDKIVQTITHMYIAYEGEDPQDQPGWYDYEHYKAMAVRNGLSDSKAKYMADLLFKSYSSSYSVSPDKKTLTLGKSQYTLED